VAIAAIGELLAREIPGATITRMEKCGHYPMLEQPDQWAKSLQSFLNTLINAK
jgi:pimeloyl-ACP methyl ester carboxylesterase